MRRYASLSLALLLLWACVPPAQAQLRIVTYNTANGTFPSGNNPNPRTGMDSVLQAIANEVTNGISKPIDVLIFQEHDDPSTTTQAFVNMLNGIYGPGTYARSTVITLPNYDDNIRQTLVYNTDTLSLIGETTFGETGSGKAARQTARFQLRPVGYDSSADFYIYNSHYKAGSSDEARRNFEANSIRTNSDALGQGTHAIYAGDFNMYTSSEAGYQTLLSAGNGQAFDPINTPGNWNNSFTYRAVHTQSPHDGSDGLVGGGMDDRFDFQLVTGEFLDNEGLSYIPGSYHAFGNNGTTYNQAVNAASNTYPVSQSVLDALAHVSDHLPVVADYQLPAKMGVSVGFVPLRVIAGTAVSVPVTVTNTAPVLTVNGADELDYVVSSSDDVTGGAVGVANPVTTGNLHNLSFDTSTAGDGFGFVNVVSTSQSVADGIFAQGINVAVLDHAKASFASGFVQDLLTIDFGTLSVGGTVIDAFDIYNIEQTIGYTAGLDIDSIIGVGDTAVLSNGLLSSDSIAGGSSQIFLPSFDTSNVGSFSATYTFNLSDEDVPGATSQVLTLQLLGKVVDVLVGDLNGDGFVGIGDLNIVLGNWNQNVTAGDKLLGDPSGDGFVGIEDLNTVLGNWNAGTPPGGNAVPEPGTLSVLGLCVLAAVRRR